MSTVLVVDDAQTDRELLSKLVLGAGHRVITAADGKEALEVAKAQKPDLIFLDVVMPNMDGFAACRNLKKDPATAGIPVILVTSKATDSDKFWSKKQGADDHISKPWARDTIEGRAAAVLSVSVGGAIGSAPTLGRTPAASGEVPTDTYALAEGVVVFDVAGQRCGLSVAVTREVVHLERLIDVPRAPLGVLGLFPLRGAPLCAIDAASVLDERAPSAQRAVGLVVTRGRQAICALAIDRVESVVRIAASAVIPPDDSRESPIVRGFCAVADRTITLLEPDELLRRIEQLRFH